MSRAVPQMAPTRPGDDPDGGGVSWWAAAWGLGLLLLATRVAKNGHRPREAADGSGSSARSGVATRERFVAAGPQPAPAPAPKRVPGRLRWWKEVVYAAAFYAVYSGILNTQGSATVSAAHAMRNALRVVHLERTLMIYHEQAIQHAFLGDRLFIEFWNLFYGSFHFVVTTVALVVLFRRFPQRYRRWRNTLAITTGLALIGFATYPLMPPRLLPSSFHFVDTLKSYGALWSFDSGTVAKISNQYAAMPSLHFAWSTWSALVLVPAVKPLWGKALAAVYPALTLFAIVVTANHYFLDAAGGAVILATGSVLGFALAAKVEGRPWRAVPAA